VIGQGFCLPGGNAPLSHLPFIIETGMFEPGFLCWRIGLRPQPDIQRRCLGIHCLHGGAGVAIERFSCSGQRGFGSHGSPP